jgi:hypothetical protein
VRRSLLRALALALLAGLVGAAAAASFPLTAADTPDDDGRSLTLRWERPADAPARWNVERREVRGSFAPIGFVAGAEDVFLDANAQTGTAYEYRLVAAAGSAVTSDVSPPATATLQWFNASALNVLVVVILFGALIFHYIVQAQRGRMAGFRKIAGLTAIEEAIGRATEMGKGVLYVPGIQDVDDIQTIASMIILGNVARMTAKYEAALHVPTITPAVYTVADEVVKSAYSDVGRIDAYRSDQVWYVTTEQFAYVAAVNGLMLRERPAANLFLGAFFAESLLLAETGHATGAVQIAGTANVHQLPFFVVACDYTLIGEEYYAASAYLSNEPRLLGSLKASDVIKVLTLAALALGVALEGFGIHGFHRFFGTR